jgi:hypothetical protein
MNKAELAEPNKIYNGNIHIVGPGYKWLVEGDATEPKPKLASAEIMEQVKIARDELGNNGFTEKSLTAMIKAFAYVQEFDESLYHEVLKRMRKAPESPTAAETPEA